MNKKRKRIVRSSLLIGAIGLAILVVFFVNRAFNTPKETVAPTIQLQKIMIKKISGEPVANAAVSISNLAYRWNGFTDKDGLAQVPPQTVGSPTQVCVTYSPRTTQKTCDDFAKIDETYAPLDSANTVTINHA